MQKKDITYKDNVDITVTLYEVNLKVVLKLYYHAASLPTPPKLIKKSLWGYLNPEEKAVEFSSLGAFIFLLFFKLLAYSFLNYYDLDDSNAFASILTIN